MGQLLSAGSSPVEDGGSVDISVVFEELIVEDDLEVLALMSDLPVLCSVVLAAPVKDKLSNLYMCMDRKEKKVEKNRAKNHIHHTPGILLMSFLRGVVCRLLGR